MLPSLEIKLIKTAVSINEVLNSGMVGSVGNQLFSSALPFARKFIKPESGLGQALGYGEMGLNFLKSQTNMASPGKVIRRNFANNG